MSINETVAPTIVADIKLGKDIAFTDLDIVSVTERMRAKGFTDDEINKTVIELSAQQPAGHGEIVQGDYRHNTNTIRLFPLNHKKEYGDPAFGPISHGQYKRFGAAGMLATQTLSATLEHELTHREAALRGSSPEMHHETLRRHNSRNKRVERAVYGGVAASGLALDMLDGKLEGQNLVITALATIATAAAADLVQYLRRARFVEEDHCIDQAKYNKKPHAAIQYR